MRRIKNYLLKAVSLSPIHIGDGSEIEPLEYVITDSKLYKINLGDFLTSLSAEELKELNEIQQKDRLEKEDLVNIRKFIKSRFDPATDEFEWYAQVSNTVKEVYEDRFAEPENQLKMNPFIRTQDKPYIPGSSIKGAIRTALLNHWSDEIEKLKDKKAQNVEAQIYGGLQGKRQKNGSIRYLPDISKDPFRTLKIKDVYLPDNSTIFSKVSNFRLLPDDKLDETNIQIICEVVRNPVSFEVQIGIDKEIFNIRQAGLRKAIDLNTMLEVCNDYYVGVLESEKTRLFAGKDEEIVKLYDKIKKEAEDGYLMRLGWGCGFEAMTIEKFRRPNKPKRGKGGWGYSKHLVESKYPLGWVKLIVED
jgi:CRISPR-associated protein Csm5